MKGSLPKLDVYKNDFAKLSNLEMIFTLCLIVDDVLLGSIRATFCISRRRAAEKLKNPRLLQIHFHTLRHWKATMLYHQTKDVLYVMNFLGHKSVRNTMLYIQLEQAIFKEALDEFVTRVTKGVKGARALVEAGFVYVLEMDGLRLFRKRK